MKPLKRPEGISNQRWRKMKERHLHEQIMIQRRLEMLRYLRQHQYDPKLDTLSHTIRYKGSEVSVSEREYLWLYVRGHLRVCLEDATVQDNQYISMKEDDHATETNPTGKYPPRS
jgi:hypothetical protein